MEKTIISVLNEFEVEFDKKIQPRTPEQRKKAFKKLKCATESFLKEIEKMNKEKIFSKKGDLYKEKTQSYYLLNKISKHYGEFR